MKHLFVFMMLAASQVAAETVVPSRTIRANAVIEESDLKFADMATENAFTRMADVVGQEARVVLYAGRPIRLDDIGPPAVVARNQIVQLFFSSDALSIVTEGRALERGAVGDRIRVMNLGSRTVIFGQVLDDGSIRVRK